MFRYRSRVEVDNPAGHVFAWLERPGALTRMTPPWERARVIAQQGTVHDGDRVSIKLARPPVTLTMVHEQYERGRRFVDRMESGPFRSWQHAHEVIARGAGATLTDQIDYALPLAPLSNIARPIVEGRLRRMFAYRDVVLANDLAAHARFPGALRVAVTGASGTIGRQLCAFLSTGGHEVMRLVRREARGADEISWDPDGGTIDRAKLEGLDAVVHLAGENVGGRWTAERKLKIIGSRVRSTALLAGALAGLREPPRVLVSASGTGYYGAAASAPCDESAPRGDDFLAEVAVAWEAAGRAAEDAGIRVAYARIGAVLTPDGGALEKMVPAYLAFGGGPIGSGHQPFAWIGIDDALYALHHMMCDASLAGPVNVVSPELIDNAELARTIGKVVHRPAVVRLPAPVIEMLFGELGKVVLLGGQRAVPARLERAGFRFAQPALEATLRHVLGRAN